MDLKETVKPITYLKNNAAQLVERVARDRRPVIITQKGQARVVVMDVDTYGEWRDALALLRIVSLSEAEVAAGRTVTQAEAFARARRAIRSADGD